MAFPSGGGANVKGLKQVGNIDTMKRPVVRNKDGSVSTVRSISFGTPQGEVLVPRVVGRKVVSPAAAWQHYQKTGQHLGIFKNVATANAYAKQLHKDQASTAPVTAALARQRRAR